jgi:Leucine-rich repeat (LRR) protein
MNNLTARLPAWFERLVSLETLDCSSNRLEDIGTFVRH